MKAVTFKLNTVLAAVAGALCLLAVLLRTFAPITVQLPNIDIPCLAAVSLIAIVVDCYLDWKKLTPHCWALTAVMAFLTFWAAAVGRRARGGRRCGPARRRDRRGAVHCAGVPVRHHPGAPVLRQEQHPRPAVRGRGDVPGLPVLCGHAAVR